MTPKPLVCEKCGKKLSKKRARQINGVIMCSPCMFGQTSKKPEGVGRGNQR